MILLFISNILDTQLEGHRELTTNFEEFLVSPCLRAFLSIFRKQFSYFSLFDELQVGKCVIGKTNEKGIIEAK